MTAYSPQVLAADWEFKIIRSVFNQFGDQAIRDRVLDDESQNGWVLVEVFDNARIRLKRRWRPSEEGFDPYRTDIPYNGISVTQARRMASTLAFMSVVVVGTVGVTVVLAIVFR